MTLVMKFGGTSVGSPSAIRQTAELIEHSLAQWGQVVVVASAMGSQPIKVTDLLLNGAYAALEGQSQGYRQVAQSLRQIHHQTIAGLLSSPEAQQPLLAEINQFVERYEALCQAVLVLGELTPRALDAISAMGEQMSVRIVAAYLRQSGRAAQAVDATELILTDDNFQAATPQMAETTSRTQARLNQLLEQGIVPIVTGFIGATGRGITTTLGRGGSDFSAAILGQALAASEVWIWTDVDGVMTSDPRLVPAARTISSLTYREVGELAYYGAKVLHPKTIRPCVDGNIPLRIKNTFNPDHPGTLIVPDLARPGNGAMKAVTAIKNLSFITVEGRGMLGVPGMAARTFGAVARQQVNVLLITQASSEQSICFATPAGATDQTIAALESEFAPELARQDIDKVWALRPVSIITVVGGGIRRTSGIAGQLFGALGRQAINILAIAQGSSECSISLVVEDKDTTAAVACIHELL